MSEYPFSGKIVESYYTNPELDTVCVLWSDGERNREYYINVDENDHQFQALLKEWSYEQIDEATKARNEQYRDEFRMAFHNYAMEHDLYGHGNPDENKALLDHSILKSEGKTDPDLVQGSLNMLFEFDIEDKVHKEDLFKLKLKMFEQPKVEKSKSQKLKADLRKSSTPMEAIAVYTKFK